MIRAWRNLTLATQLVIPTAALIFVVVSSITFLTIQQEETLLANNLRSEALATLDLVDAAATPLLLDLRVSEVTELLTQETRNWQASRMYGANGRLLFDSAADGPNFILEPDPVGLELIALESNMVEDQPDSLIVSKAVRAGNQTVGAITLEFSKTDIQAELDRVRWQGRFVAAIIISLSIAIISLLSRLFSQAIGILIEGTEQIGAGNLDHQVPMPGNYELNAVARSLNDMSADLDLTRRQLEQRSYALRDALTLAEKARDEAEIANKAKSEFLAKVSHELKTPLGGILGNVELLYSQAFGATTEKQSQTLLKVMKSSHYLVEMINELLDQAKLESGEFSVRYNKFAVQEFVDAIESRVGVLAEAEGLTLNWEIDAAFPPEIITDERRFQQIAINLITNAIKFTAEGGIITVGLGNHEDGFMRMKIHDTGMGISDEDLQQIFEPFKQVGYSVTSHKEGIGLGLSIVKQLVDLMGGRLEVESQVDAGTTFFIYLPITSELEEVR